jgi:hypothetical protein
MKVVLNSDWLGAYTGPWAAGNADWSMKAALNSDWWSLTHVHAQQVMLIGQ